MSLVKSNGVYNVVKSGAVIETVTPVIFFTNLAAATNNQSIIGGVALKVIRILSMRIASSNAAGNLYIKSASAGTGRGLYNVPAAATYLDVQIPEFENGIMEMAVGQGMFGDTTGAGFTPYISGMCLIYTA